jgi:ribosomal protein L37AE/L43A
MKNVRKLELSRRVVTDNITKGDVELYKYICTNCETEIERPILSAVWFCPDCGEEYNDMCNLSDSDHAFATRIHKAKKHAEGKPWAHLVRNLVVLSSRMKSYYSVKDQRFYEKELEDGFNKFFKEVFYRHLLEYWNNAKPSGAVKIKNLRKMIVERACGVLGYMRLLLDYADMKPTIKVTSVGKVEQNGSCFLNIDIKIQRNSLIFYQYHTKFVKTDLGGQDGWASKATIDADMKYLEECSLQVRG